MRMTEGRNSGGETERPPEPREATMGYVPSGHYLPTAHPGAIGKVLEEKVDN
jgi:hypothetical protein